MLILYANIRENKVGVIICWYKQKKILEKWHIFCKDRHVEVNRDLPSGDKGLKSRFRTLWCVNGWYLK